MDLNWGAQHLLLLLHEMGGNRELITLFPCNILGIICRHVTFTYIMLIVIALCYTYGSYFHLADDGRTAEV